MFYLLFFLIVYKSLEKADVYFTKNIKPSNIVTIFKKLNVKLFQNVGLKVHTGEEGGKYFLTPDFLQDIYNFTDKYNGTFIESNAVYDGSRNTTNNHEKILETHKWKENGRRAVILDEDSNKDFIINISTKNYNCKFIKENKVGGNLKDYNTSIVLTHFKGNHLAGFGGALKHLATGFASQEGKAPIYTAGKTKDWHNIKNNLANPEDFTTAMAEAASSIFFYYSGKKDKTLVFINVLANISLDCDCMGNLAPEPKIKDIGILASIDPVALDQACYDLIKKSTDNGTDELLSQIEDRYGTNIIDVANKIGFGTKEYNFIDIDEEKKTILGFILFLSIIFICTLSAGILAFYLGRKSKPSKEKNISLVEKNDE